MNKLRVFFTLTGYQLTWLSCAFGESSFNNAKLGIYVGIVYLILYLYFSSNKRRFIKVSLLISIPGYLFDTLMVYFQIYFFNTSIIFGTLPIWMLILWLSFSTLFDEVLVFFKNYKTLGIILSSILGPITYYLGEPIGIVSIKNPIIFVTFMIFFWFFLMFYYLEIILKKV